MNNKLTTEKHFNRVDLLHKEVLTLLRVKNSGYSPGDDPFNSFRSGSSFVGSDNPSISILTRIGEKVERFKNLVVGSYTPSDWEDVREEAIDLIGLLSIYTVLGDWNEEPRNESAEEEKAKEYLFNKEVEEVPIELPDPSILSKLFNWVKETY